MTKPDWLTVFTHEVMTPSVPQLTVRKLIRGVGRQRQRIGRRAVHRAGRVRETWRAARPAAHDVRAAGSARQHTVAAVVARLPVHHARHSPWRGERVPGAIRRGERLRVDRRQRVDVQRGRICRSDSRRSERGRGRDTDQDSGQHARHLKRAAPRCASPDPKSDGPVSTGPARGPPSPPAARSGRPSADGSRTACRSSRPTGTGWRSSGAPDRPAAAPAAAGHAPPRR